MNRALLSLLTFACAIALLVGCRKTADSDKSAEHFTIVTGSGIEMVYVPGGQFTMGSSTDSPEEAPPHKVTITAFLMDKCPATHDLFETLQLPDGSHWSDPKSTPVESIRWRDAKVYCNVRSLKDGLKPCYNEKTIEWDCDFTANGYRLPTEAEWEFAARAGSDKPYDFGSPDQLSQYAWFADNSDKKTHPVGQKKPNAWGLYDMYGNVSQWCEDVYDPAYYKTSPSTDPTGPPSPGHDVKRVMRGGNWSSSAETCRATYRRGERTGNTDACFATSYCGFRCVRRASAEDLAQLRKGK